MTENDLDELKQRFLNYSDGFIRNALDNKPYVLKREHTLRVLAETDKLSSDLGLSGELALLARAAALFHDVGRFCQFRDYGTFSDKASENHAHLGAGILRKTKLMAGLAPEECRQIISAVGYHNASALPEHLDSDGLLILKMLRDSDKMDIWRVMVDHYRERFSKDRSYVVMGLNETRGFSDRVLDVFFKNSMVDLRFVKNLNDLKVMQISWVFDLNFSQSTARVKRRRYVESIASTLPSSEDTERVVNQANRYMEELLVNGAVSK